MPKQSPPSALRTFLLLILATLAALALAACRQPAVPTPTPAAAEAGSALGDVLSASQLAGTSWQAVAFGGAGDTKPVDPATTLTLNFGVERYLGSGGCNWFLGVYDVSGDQMELRAPTQTILECTQPANVMQQESMYLSALWNIDEYRTLDEKLLAYATEDQLLLTFVPAKPVPLEDTTWSLKFQLADEQITPLIADTTITAVLAGGRITGSAGCSTYDGAYTLEGDQFAVSDLTTTKQECTTPDGIMDQEALYLANLSAATRLIQTAGVLQLLDADGETILAYAAP